MAKSGGAMALVSVLSVLLGACASNQSIEQVGVMDLPVVTRVGIQPADQVGIAFYTAAGVKLEQISGDRVEGLDLRQQLDDRHFRTERFTGRGRTESV